MQSRLRAGCCSSSGLLFSCAEYMDVKASRQRASAHERRIDASGGASTIRCLMWILPKRGSEGASRERLVRTGEVGQPDSEHPLEPLRERHRRAFRVGPPGAGALRTGARGLATTVVLPDVIRVSIADPASLTA